MFDVMLIEKVVQSIHAGACDLHPKLPLQHSSIHTL